ncbi:TonB-dependent receptor [Neptunicella marina]|uniref:TonB-dependent receptor n=1 Tax=Neptunicella marina TaxID=2125989 RepID=A0A8J6M112_9ALTE|nr:TonB-dependent receptor [Neptunicella marina]MBC3765233.1 TonB-dependent receptor [Neptunicella marina]
MKYNKLAVALAVATAMGSATAQEQQADTQKEQKEFEQIVVTGTPGGTAVRKVDASYAITNLSAETMTKLAPKSTAELFVAVPGVWSESSGGVSGANVFVRGMPGGGDAPFLTVQLEGAPVYQPPTVSFLENSSLFRMDETVSFMEALRGGPNPVISNGQPGLTTNFMLKEGTAGTEGTIKYTTSDYDLQRLDAVVSGELGDDYYFMIGGYVKSSPGIRDAGFTSEKGHQFTINLTKELDNGKINLYTRVTDDHGVWYLPTPLVDGVDAGYTQIGVKNRQTRIQYGPNGDALDVDLGDGRGWDGSISGGKINLDLGSGWTFTDRFNFTKGDANTFGLVPDGSPVALSSVADNGESAVGISTGKTYGGSTLVQQMGTWVVLKEIESFTNDLALSKQFDSLKTTFGMYASSFSANDWWAIGNQKYQVVEQGGEQLTGIDCNDNADSCGWSYDINSAGDGRTRAFYGAFEYDVNEQLKLDLGIRRENHVIQYTVDEGLDGQIDKTVDYDNNSTSWTVGGNYSLTDNSGVFARLNSGSKMPYFDDFRDNYGNYQNGNDLVFDVKQSEFGYKLAGDSYSLYATLFYNEVESSNTTVPGAPADLSVTEAKGVEIDANYMFDFGLNINMNATVQNTEITESTDTNTIGKESQRQPGWQMRITPTYEIDLDNGGYLTLYGTIAAVDDRWSDNGNTVVLDGYTKIDLGANWEMTDNFNVRVSVDNLTDKDGLTEGDPRNPAAPNGRYILPRSVRLSVGYNF